jgi:hypothetical protein
MHANGGQVGVKRQRRDLDADLKEVEVSGVPP